LDYGLRNARVSDCDNRTDALKRMVTKRACCSALTATNASDT